MKIIWIIKLWSKHYVRQEDGLLLMLILNFDGRRQPGAFIPLQEMIISW